MKRSRFSEEQVIGILREAQAWRSVKAVCAGPNISATTGHPWKRKYGGMAVDVITAIEATIVRYGGPEHGSSVLKCPTCGAGHSSRRRPFPIFKWSRGMHFPLRATKTETPVSDSVSTRPWKTANSRSSATSTVGGRLTNRTSARSPSVCRTKSGPSSGRGKTISFWKIPMNLRRIEWTVHRGTISRASCVLAKRPAIRA